MPAIPLICYGGNSQFNRLVILYCESKRCALHGIGEQFTLSECGIPESNKDGNQK